MTQQGQIKASSEDTMISAIRVLSMDAIQAASSGHPGGAWLDAGPYDQPPTGLRR